MLRTKSNLIDGGDSNLVDGGDSNLVDGEDSNLVDGADSNIVDGRDSREEEFRCIVDYRQYNEIVQSFESDVDCLVKTMSPCPGLNILDRDRVWVCFGFWVSKL